MKNDLQGYLKNDLLGSIKQTNAPLYSSLLAVKKAFIKRFQLDVFPLVPHNAPKGSVNSDRNEDIIRYPFSYWKFQTLNLVKEEQNAKTIRRRGSVSTGSSSNTDFNIGYFFPALLNCQYNYETNQLEDALAFMERWLILLTSESLNVKITLPIGQGMEFTCRIFIEDTSI
jgi:hypothetical protein